MPPLILLRMESIVITSVKVCDRNTQSIENSLIEVFFLEGVLITILINAFNYWLHWFWRNSLCSSILRLSNPFKYFLFTFEVLKQFSLSFSENHASSFKCTHAIVITRLNENKSVFLIIWNINTWNMNYTNKIDPLIN